MNTRIITLVPLAATLLALAGCSGEKDDGNPTFMFFNFREEIVERSYHVPEMKTEAVAKYLATKLQGVPNKTAGVPGYVDSVADLSANTLTIRYKSSTARAMNFEKEIAAAGFAVNGRPAYPNARIPEGVK